MTTCTHDIHRRRIAALLLLTFAMGVAQAADIWNHWALGPRTVNDTWSSGRTKNLSKWKSIDCSQYGPDYLLSGLVGYKDPSTNLDRFIARLEATCTSFDQSKRRSVTLFRDKHRDGAHRVDVFINRRYICPAHYYHGPYGGVGMPTELNIITDPKGDYVQNLNIVGTCVNRRDDGFLFWARVGGETYLIDNFSAVRSRSAEIACPDKDWVATAIALRFDTKKGKIRDMRLTCRELFRRDS